MKSRKSLARTIVAALVLVGSLAGSAAAEPANQANINAWTKTINNLGKKLLCVCHDGSEFEGYAGTIQTTGFIDPPRAVPVGCIIPQFDFSTSELTGNTACYTYDVLH